MSKPSTDSLDSTDRIAVSSGAPISTLAALYQRELARLAELERQQAALARRIRHQGQRVAMAERLCTGGGQQ